MPNQSSDTRSALVKYASFILNRRPYFRHQLESKLILRAKKLKLSDCTNEIKSILDSLDKSGYLDDSYLSKAFVRRQLSKGYGSRIIKIKLQVLKLPASTIDTALEEEGPVSAQIDSAKQYLSKKRYKDQRIAQAALYKRGFEPKIIRKIFDSELFED